MTRIKRDVREIIWSKNLIRNHPTITYHGYYSTIKIVRVSGKKVDGNAMLCHRKLGVMDHNNIYLPLKEIYNNGFDEQFVCKKCLMIYNRLYRK